MINFVTSLIGRNLRDLSVLHTTYPTLQRTFVVTYVILSLRAFVHRLAPIRPIPLSSTTPRSPNCPAPRRSHRSRAHLPAHPVAATSRFAHADCAAGLFSRIDADKDMENKAAAACLPFRSSSRSWLGRRGAGSGGGCSFPAAIAIHFAFACLSKTHARIHFPALFQRADVVYTPISPALSLTRLPPPLPRLPHALLDGTYLDNTSRCGCALTLSSLTLTRKAQTPHSRAWLLAPISTDRETETGRVREWGCGMWEEVEMEGSNAQSDSRAPNPRWSCCLVDAHAHRGWRRARSAGVAWGCILVLARALIKAGRGRGSADAAVRSRASMGMERSAGPGGGCVYIPPTHATLASLSVPASLARPPRQRRCSPTSLHPPSLGSAAPPTYRLPCHRFVTTPRSPPLGARAHLASTLVGMELEVEVEKGHVDLPDLPTPHARVDPLASRLPRALPSPRRLRALARLP
ncbi:hypothetical protein B0H13DRAFT_2671147 [Mycena leptocephala]|nr:hypothetical protein B0H13DRAFT_2671147 [Mycena leptocephala]